MLIEQRRQQNQEPKVRSQIVCTWMQHAHPLLVALVAAATAAVISVPPCLAFIPPPNLRSAHQIPHGSRQGTTATARTLSQATSLSSSPLSTPRHLLLHKYKDAMMSSTGSSSGGEGNRRVVVVGLNGALQRTIVFAPPKGLKVGDVNRASSVGAGIGGKGQNVCVALRTLAESGEQGGLDVTLAHFAGGKSGE